jgi:D-alanyl-D-alanine carboxypeptidase/D-alanyl-D-alanine-endopeptidase (penicillin-binding protein 4)
MTSCRHLPIVAVACAIAASLAACSPNAIRGGSDRTRVVGGPKLSAKLDEVLRRGQTGPAKYTARVLDVQSGRELYAVDADTPFMPASNGKIAVSAAALDFFGSDHAFKTYLALDGDDLWLIGTGDPGVGDNTIAKKSGGTTMTVLDEWADALKRRGVTTLTGNLYYYDRELDDELVHPSWSKGYITDWYAAPIAGLNFNNNCIDISVKPTDDGKPVAYSIIPPTKRVGVKLENKVLTGEGKVPDADRELDANVFTITGATTRPMDVKSEAITEPAPFFADALRTHLESKGITIAGETRRASAPLGGTLVPPKAKLVAVHETKMADAISRINKQSQNNFAEGFIKMLGRAYAKKHGRDEPGSWKDGSEAVLAFLKRNKIDTDGIVIADGSGLSRDNRVTSRMISDVFCVMWRHREKETFFDSLTIAGVDGTIGKRMYDLKGRVHAKTGFIGGVRSLSGYVQNDDGKWLVFSIIYNGFSGSAGPYEDLQDNAVRVLAAWPKEVKLPATRRAATTRSSTRTTTRSTTPRSAASAE